MRADHAVIAGGMLTAVALLGATGLRWRAAEQRADAEIRAMRAAEHDIARLVRLRGKRQTIAAGARPEQDLIARVNATLAGCGIPTARMQSLTQESDRAVGPESGEDALHRQSVRVVLEPVTMAELGDFLARWRAEQPLWTPTRIELNHTARRDDRVGRYAAGLLLSTTYMGERDE